MLALSAWFAIPASAASLPPPSATTTRIVIVRHGEKPAAGLGQLACKGLSRSLALADVILDRFGTPAAIFAPNPAQRKPDKGVPYAYIRPLATIEPLAIRAGLPVDIRYGFEDEKALAAALEDPRWDGKTVVVAWEHKVAVPMMRAFFKRYGGKPKQVPKWADDDFDRLDVVEIDHAKPHAPTVTYHSEREGLDAVPDTCPRVPHT